ncbi:hypothetical protein HQN86_12980 [Pedobacter panaciterrae]|uniref:hypothetical protein n=1 Tax=Pedobacter panaciterrae TaxID=363849 RepID=UPI00155DD4CB|nr:hypothetical protein [Pedobacter panaciterrae]NQX54531.1 hypothetical protein [Pedobacter panaciterrae]
MKTTGKINKRIKMEKLGDKGSPVYYFHADEDFREDWDWGKQRIVSKSISKSANKCEI